MRRADCGCELVERIDQRIALRPVDADNAIQPRRHGDGLDDERDEAALAVAHVEHFGDDGLLLIKTSIFCKNKFIKSKNKHSNFSDR